MLKLCDKTGWTYSYDKTNVGTLFNVSWSTDSTLLTAATGSGALLEGQIVDKTLMNDQWELTLQEDNRIQVVDLVNE